MALSVFLEFGDDISDYFSSQNVIERCPLINNEIMPKARFLSSGAQGGVYSVVLDGKKYAIKKSRNHGYFVRDVAVPDEVKTLGEALAYLNTHIKDLQIISVDTFYQFNKGDENTILSKREVSILVRRNKDYDCKLKDELETHVLDDSSSCLTDKFTYPKGSFLCDNSDYTEYVISVLCANLEKNGICVNFNNVFGFSMCTSSDMFGKMQVFDYTFMELLDDSLDGGLEPYVEEYDYDDERRDEILGSVAIQILFALSAMQRIYGIQHNDLHAANVMIKKLGEFGDDVMYNGYNLTKADYFSYELDGLMLYIKNEGFLCKLIDFGFATKYSTPMVGRLDVVKNKTDSNGWRDDYADVDKIFTSLNEMFGGYELFQEISDGGKRPWEFLEGNHLTENFYIKPSSGTIVSLGKLTRDDYYTGFFTPDQSLAATDVSRQTYQQINQRLVDIGNSVESVDYTTISSFIDKFYDHPEWYSVLYQRKSKLTKECLARFTCVLEYYVEKRGNKDELIAKTISHLNSRIKEIRI
jgi:serine/threonine protein kinase